MTMHVVGFSEGSSDEYIAKANAYFACLNAGIEIPSELVEYFGGQPPQIEDGIEVEIPSSPWSDETNSGVEIDPGAVPNGVRKIRFFVTA